MGKLGDLLHRSREQLGIPLVEIEATTRIKRTYLEALEAENFDIFPNQIAAQGFLRNYASALKLDAAYVLELYRQSQGRSTAGRQFHFKNISMRPFQRIWPDLFIGFLAITALMGAILCFVYYQYMTFPKMTSANSLPSSTAEVAILLPTPIPSPINTPVSTATPSPVTYTGVTVELVIFDKSLVQVLVDEAKAFEGVLDAGERRGWTGDRQVSVRAGNAGGVEIVVNGESKGLMGERDQVVDQVWEKRENGTIISPQEEITSTPTFSPTSTSWQGPDSVRPTPNHR